VSNERVTHPLARRDGIELTVGLLLVMGAMCPKCGHGTRVTSKRWAHCKKCGERVCRAECRAEEEAE
jgi:hypothetical protein